MKTPDNSTTNATCNRNRCTIPDNHERPGKNSQRLPAGPGNAEQQSIHSHPPFSYPSSSPSQLVPFTLPHHAPHSYMSIVEEPPDISLSLNTAINRGACKSNSPMRSLTTGWGSGAINLPAADHFTHSRPSPKRLKDERSTVFALLVPSLCAITLVFALSKQPHFAYMRCDVYGYVLYFFISNFLKHRSTLSLQ
jgi:hypothetical protein